MIETARQRLIFALDVDSCEAAETWATQLQGKVGLFKVGKQLFTRCGPDIVRRIQKRGGEVFLDLKYHDIPTTVARAAVEACRLGVRMVNLHALGGPAMMDQTVKAVAACCAEENLRRPLLLAVTVLTSTETSGGTVTRRRRGRMRQRLRRLRCSIRRVPSRSS